MGKFNLISFIILISSFSGGVNAALMNVASVEFTASSSRHFSFIKLNEVILSEESSGNDLALASSGATVVSSFTVSNKFFKNSPGYVIDGAVNKKSSYYFLKSFNGKNELPSLTINLAEVSDINSFNFFGYFGKAKKTYLGVNFLDINGNSIYKIANLAKTFGKGSSGTYILPDLSTQASTVPLPPSVWLFGFGLAGMFGLAKKRSAIRLEKSL